MKIKWIRTSNNWRHIADAARTTINKEEGDGEPSSNWKRRMLLAEHSPIRKLKIEAKFENVLSWVSVHLVRHKYGIEHFVSTRRSDRIGTNRNKLTQDTLVDHEIEANAQAIINISRKRLCNQASKETREAWKLFLKELEKDEPELVLVCQPECLYRGFCPEIYSCGYHKTEKFKKELEEYRRGINE